MLDKRGTGYGLCCGLLGLVSERSGFRQLAFSCSCTFAVLIGYLITGCVVGLASVQTISCTDQLTDRCLVTSIFLYACEPLTLTAELQRGIQAIEMRCYRKILHILYKDHVTIEEVRAKIQQANGPHEDLLTIVKRRKLQWYVMFPVHQV